MKQVVQDYALTQPIPPGQYRFTGNSVGCKPIVEHLFGDPAASRSILDIGFGMGDLGRVVKTNPATAHWTIDGIDGFHDACCNEALFARRWYRNIWHGLAHELPGDRLRTYDAICLFDVIEHLDPDDARALLGQLLGSLGAQSVLVLSTPLWFWPQGHHHEDDLEEHRIGVPAAALFSLMPTMFHIHSEFLVGTFVFARRSLPLVDRFVPVTDRSFGLDAGRAHLQRLGHKADNVLYMVA
jgi:hypothetical protein